MKIAILGSAHPLRGGLASYNERLAAEFIREGNEVTIYSFSLQYPQFLFPGKSQYTNQLPPAGLNIDTCVNSINPLNWIQVGLKIKKQKPDILIVKFWLPFMAPCLGTICKIVHGNKHTRILAIIDNIIPHEKRPGDRLLAQYFCHQIDAFIVMSRSVEKELKSFTQKQPIQFNPHPLFDHFGDAVPREQACRQLQIDPQCRYMLFFGFIRNYKGLDILLDALADERLKALNVKLIIAGEFYEDATPYRQKIETHQLQHKVILKTEYIPDDQVRYFFSAAELVVQPYKQATQSGVTQIAYHFEKPMLVTAVGGLPEMVPHRKAGYVTRPNANEIAECIHSFFTRNEAELFAEGIKEEKEKYRWSRLTTNIRQMLSKA